MLKLTNGVQLTLEKDYQLEEIIEGRKRLYLSAKKSYYVYGIERYQWLDNKDVIEIAKKYNLEDELEYIANCVWGDL